MTHTLIANSPVKDIVLKSILRELVSVKVVRKYAKQKHQQGKACVASAVAMNVAASYLTVTNPTPAIATATIATALKGLRTIPLVKSKLAVPHTSTGAISKTTGKTSGTANKLRNKKKNTILIKLS